MHSRQRRAPGSSHTRKKKNMQDFGSCLPKERAQNHPNLNNQELRDPLLFLISLLVLGQVFARFILWHLAADRAGDFANSIASRSFQL